MTTPAPNIPNQLRRDYTRGKLLESQLDPDPIVQFSKWFDEALKAQISQPNAVALATVGSEGAPSVRIVLVKSFDQKGLVFGTNYSSRKGRDIAQNPKASMVFFWEPLERQVRFDGPIEKTKRSESQQLFHARPREAQISAWASLQSDVVASRQALEKAQKLMASKFSHGPVPLPASWGGYRLKPATIEFWQGRAGRLHDRLVYLRQADGSWKIQRLQP